MVTYDVSGTRRTAGARQLAAKSRIHRCCLSCAHATSGLSTNTASVCCCCGLRHVHQVTGAVPRKLGYSPRAGVYRLFSAAAAHKPWTPRCLQVRQCRRSMETRIEPVRVVKVLGESWCSCGGGHTYLLVQLLAWRYGWLQGVQMRWCDCGY